MTDQELIEKLYYMRKFIGLWNPYDKDFEYMTQQYNELCKEAYNRGLLDEND